MILDQSGREKLRAEQAFEFSEVGQFMTKFAKVDDGTFEDAVTRAKQHRPEWFAKPGHETFLWFCALERRRRKAAADQRLKESSKKD